MENHAPFEDEFTELQIGLMELCLEFAEGRADRIFVFAKICKDKPLFYPIFERDGSFLLPLEMANYDLEFIKEFVGIALSDLKKIANLDPRYNEEIPIEMKMYYDTKTRRYDAGFRYEKNLPNYDAEKAFQDWYEKLKVRCENRRYDLL